MRRYAEHVTTRRPRRDRRRIGARGAGVGARAALAGAVAAMVAPKPRRGRRADADADTVELRLRVTPEMATSLEAGIPCREVRVERIGDDQIALLVRASDREQWLMHVVAHARRAAWN